MNGFQLSWSRRKSGAISTAVEGGAKRDRPGLLVAPYSHRVGSCKRGAMEVDAATGDGAAEKDPPRDFGGSKKSAKTRVRMIPPATSAPPATPAPPKGHPAGGGGASLEDTETEAQPQEAQETDDQAKEATARMGSVVSVPTGELALEMGLELKPGSTSTGNGAIVANASASASASASDSDSDSEYDSTDESDESDESDSESDGSSTGAEDTDGSLKKKKSKGQSSAPATPKGKGDEDGKGAPNSGGGTGAVLYGWGAASVVWGAKAYQEYVVPGTKKAYKE